jgi:acetyl esterase/lipase
VTEQDEVIAGVPCVWIKVDGAPEDQVIFHVHGGGFISGEPCSKLYAMIRIALIDKVNILSVDYRLAPEHPYPAALEDCLSAYQGLLDKGISPDKVVFLGESAGAALVLLTARALESRSLPMPGGIVSISPIADCSKPLSAPERVAIAPNDPVLDEAETVPLYVDKHDPTDPLISVRYGSFRNFPPVLLHVGTHEVLAWDAQEIIKGCVRDDVDLRVHFWSEMEHGLFLFAGVFPEATAAGDEIAAFIRERLAQ